MQKPCVLAALILTASTAYAQDPQPLQISQVPWRSAALKTFAPRGWHIEQQINGDLNRDKHPDAALVLVQNKPAKDDADNPAPRARALVLALRDGKSWRRAGFNASLLLGTRDGGAFYGVVETPVEVSIKKGVLNVDQEAGSREVSQMTYRFRLDKKTLRFFLIGYERNDRDRATGGFQTLSCNFLTGQKKTTTSNISSDHETSKMTVVSRRLRALESVTGEQEF